MKALILLALLVSCSRGSGTYTGQSLDVGWEGYFFDTCELSFRSSEQSSTSQYASSFDKNLCDELQSNIGKKYVVKWKHKFPSFTTDSNYIIESIKEVK